MIRANAGHESLDRLVELNLSLEQLGRLGSCLAICSSLRSLTLSNNSLSALQGAPRLPVWLQLRPICSCCKAKSAEPLANSLRPNCPGM